MAIYAVNRSYFWNSNPWFIPACPPCAGVHPWLENEKQKEPSSCILAIVRAGLTDSGGTS